MPDPGMHKCEDEIISDALRHIVFESGRELEDYDFHEIYVNPTKPGVYAVKQISSPEGPGDEDVLFDGLLIFVDDAEIEEVEFFTWPPSRQSQ